MMPASKRGLSENDGCHNGDACSHGGTPTDVLGSIQSMTLKRVRFSVNQATRQCNLAVAAGLPLAWHVASPEAARDLRLLFGNEGVTGVRVRYARPGPLRC
jgi:hypothetical protein